ncbi:transcription termination factor MTERF5, chloroplastic [Mercurialis annua]|uniref:transcription termination factor MTERF5, chloroplastic n=1 Tax=Mercurialis annua TaxID=3986 RepID=UPI00215F8E20|nr:transcription termination factor MTERF5, chloroplastic [Mercurialis annua]
MQTVKSPFSTSSLYNFLANAKHLFNFAIFSSLAPTSKVLNPNLFHYLIKTVKLSETQALTISNRYSHIKSTATPQSVYQFFQNLGFSDSHIRSAIRVSPQVLFSTVDKSLKPKIKFFQDLGLVGYELGKFISKNSTVLTASLEKKLVPRIEIVKKLLLNDEENKDLLKVLTRCYWIISKYPESRLVSNVAFLESCGIVGSQLSMLLRRQPRFFLMQESALRELVSRVVNMGFSVDSRMLVYALYTVNCMSDETFTKKVEILKSFEFSEYECREMFRKQPNLLRSSEKKLKLGIDFFLNTIKFKKEVLVYKPTLLMMSIEERVIPRYKVLEIIKSKKLLKKQPSFINVLNLTEDEFMQKFIARFPNEAVELLVAYEGRTLESFSEKEEEGEE